MAQRIPSEDKRFRGMDDQSSSNTELLEEEEMSSPKMYYVATTLGKQEWLDGHDILVSAGTAWKNPGSNGADKGFDISIPAHEELFVDSGGFQATAHFGSEFPYDDSDLFLWAEDIGADYVSGMDFACEHAEVLEEAIESVNAAHIPSIDERVERTINQQIEQYTLYTELADREGGWSFDFVPVVQGYSVEQYRYCAEQLKANGVTADYMAIGSVCKRDKPDKILAVLNACRDVLPGTEFHLFGADRRVWKDSRFWGTFRSSDTHAWAVSHPDGGWPSNKEEKEEAFVHFDADIQQVSSSIEQQTTISGQADTRQTRANQLPGNDTGGECSFCGTTIPTYGVGFTPGCTACERIERNRAMYSRSRVEIEAESLARCDNSDTAGSDSTGQCTFTNGEWGTTTSGGED